jgi:small subunit ribosomal protein S20
MATPLVSSPPSSEEEIKPLEKLIAEAYQEIDKAVVKGILHRNNAARKKSRVARYKRLVLMSAGLFKPAEGHPDYAYYQRMQVSMRLPLQPGRTTKACHHVSVPSLRPGQL